MSFSMFKENFTSGFTSIRRRLSSSDIPGDVQEAQQPRQSFQQPPTQPQPQPPVPASGSQQMLSQPQQQQMRPSALPMGAPQAPSKMASAPTSPQQSTMPTFAKGLFSAASNYVSAAVSSATTTSKDGPVKGKTILVIDDDSTDWAKYFRGKKVHDIEVRLEQAEFRELHLVSMPRGDVVVEIHAQRGGTMVQRYLKPDMVVVRQHVLNDQPGRLANDDNRRLIVGLDTSGMPAVNSLASIFNFADRGWVYSNLLKIQRRFGAERFPLLDKSFYANYQELIECPPTYKGPVVIKTGNGHAGLGKMKLEAGLDIREIAHLLMGSTTGGQAYVTVEPFIDARADIYIIKIGAGYKVYSRKSAQGHWKATLGPQHLELLQLNDRYKFWVDQCAELFGGLDIVAVSVIQAKDGREFIAEVKDSTTQLTQENDDERRLIADLCVSKLNYFTRGEAALSMEPLCSTAEPVVIKIRATSQHQTPSAPVPTPPNPAPPPSLPKQSSFTGAEPPKPPVPVQNPVSPPSLPKQASLTATEPPKAMPPPPVQQPQPVPQGPRPVAPPPPQPQTVAPKPPPQPLQTQAQQVTPRPVAPPQPPPPQPQPAPMVPPPQPITVPPAGSSHNPFLADMVGSAPMPTTKPTPPPPLVPTPAPPPPIIQSPPHRAELPRQQSQPSSVPPPVPSQPIRAPPPIPPPAIRPGGPPPPLVPAPPQIRPSVPPPPGTSQGPRPPLSTKSQSLMEDTEDTMKNLKKTFAGIFGEM